VIFDVTLAETDRARDLLAEVAGISARDAIHHAAMLIHDADLIGYPGIKRVKLTEPRP